MLLHHDNAPAYRAEIVTEFLEDNDMQMTPYPPYSPDLAPSNFWLFPKLKDHLRGEWYESQSQLGSVIFQYMKHMSQDDFTSCYQQWQNRLKRCVEVKGEYFEKLWSFGLKMLCHYNFMISCLLLVKYPSYSNQKFFPRSNIRPISKSNTSLMNDLPFDLENNF